MFEGVAVLSPHPGIRTRRVDLAQMTVVEYTFEPGARFPLHHHPEEQLVVVLAGEARFTVGDRLYVLHAGESLPAAPHLPHGCEAGPGGCKFVNVLAPRREPGAGVVYS